MNDKGLEIEVYAGPGLRLLSPKEQQATYEMMLEAHRATTGI